MEAWIDAIIQGSMVGPTVQCATVHALNVRRDIEPQ